MLFKLFSTHHHNDIRTNQGSFGSRTLVVVFNGILFIVGDAGIAALSSEDGSKLCGKKHGGEAVGGSPMKGHGGRIVFYF